MVFQTAHIERTQKHKHKQTAKGPPFVWTDIAEKAFGWIKKSFSGTGVLEHFNPHKCIHLEMDAPKFAIAAILSQFQEKGQWHPVAFWSRKLIPAETRYKTYDQELLVIVAAFKQWRYYLEGSTQTIEVLTDYNNLVAFQNVKSLNSRQAQWAITLFRYDFTIAYQPGKRNPADALSRCPDYAPSMNKVNKQAGQPFPTLQKKLAQISPMPLSREAAKWVKETSQDLHRLHKLMVDARENPRPSLIVAELYGDHAESREEGGLPSGTEGSDNSDEEALLSQSHKVHSEDLATSLGQ